MSGYDPNTGEEIPYPGDGRGGIWGGGLSQFVGPLLFFVALFSLFTILPSH